jgi:diguanylate cyclase (GGDEF)-like protein/PAS domain S-box-containing protein
VFNEASNGAGALHDELTRMLDLHPTAEVLGIDERARLCPLPASVPTGPGHRTPAMGNGVDLVDPPDRALAVDAFLRVTTAGSTRASLHLVDGDLAELTFYDVRAAHGLIVAVIVRVGPGETGAVPEAADLAVRYARCERNEAGVIIAMDDDVHRLLGFSADELIGHEPLARIHPDDVERDIANWIDTLTAPNQPRRWRGRHLRPGGGWLWIEFTNVNHLDDPDHPHVVSDMIDISDEMALIEELREREELLRRLTESLPLGIVQIALDRTIVHQNDRVDEVVGRAGATLFGDKLGAVVDEDAPALEAAVAAVLEQGEDAALEVRLQPAPGDPLLVVSITFRALLGEHGQPTGAILSMWDVTESRQMHEELERHATVDALTGCLNRRAVVQRLTSELTRRMPDGMGTAVVFIDLDGFKAINDELGHAAGDELLTAVSDRLRATMRGHDVVGRLGGDEFLIVFPGVPHPEQALELGQRLADHIHQPMVVAGEPMTPRASFGVAWAPNGAATPEALVALADAAMYESKSRGGGAAVLAGRGA